MVDEEIMNRAYAAYYRGYKGREGMLATPGKHSGVEKVKGLRYAVLRDSSRLLAVYRHRPDGSLKRLRRVPQKLEAGL